jgi:hypothetical protein
VETGYENLIDADNQKIMALVPAAEKAMNMSYPEFPKPFRPCKIPSKTQNPARNKPATARKYGLTDDVVDNQKQFFNSR